MKCAKRACWANTKLNEHLPEDGRGRGMISVGKMMPTKYKYQKCKYILLTTCLYDIVFKGKQFESLIWQKTNKINW